VSVAAVCGLAVLLAAEPFITWLQARQFGKTIRTDGPQTHLAKAGTPTMGGLLILAPVAVAGVWAVVSGSIGLMAVLLAMLLFGGLGLVDDLAGLATSGRWRLSTERGVGLVARYALAAQVVLGAACSVILLRLEPDSPTMLVAGAEVNLGRLAWLAVATFVLVGTSNAFNITDGLDGLASGVGILTFGAYGILAAHRGQTGVWLLCAAAIGSMAGFLWYNSHPAQVIMGNVGSMALGAGLAAVSLLTRAWQWLPVIGLLLVVEALSVLIQVGYFKWSGGRRVFRMAPIHHHFELGGWSETQTVQRLWLVAATGSATGLALALM
jgi:phospho-N-acetylmuramoyl-pentapeptide-transferase